MNVIETIKKLLALGSNNTNEAEMAAALAKAANLAMKNNLDIHEIMSDGNDDNGIGEFAVYDEHGVAAIPAFDRLLWAGLAEVFGGCTIHSKRYHTFNGITRIRMHIEIIAPKGIKDTILYLGTYLHRQGELSWRENKKKIIEYSGWLHTDATLRDHFLREFAFRIIAKVKKIFTTDYPDTQALVLATKSKTDDYVQSITGGRTTAPLKPQGDRYRYARICGALAAENTSIHKALNNMDNDQQGKIEQ